jgi:hypothetical protein
VARLKLVDQLAKQSRDIGVEIRDHDRSRIEEDQCTGLLGDEGA